eukprot:scaffold1318_cov362-Pavlova_lutheri.AAC.9
MAAAMASANLSARATMRGTKLQTSEAKVSTGRGTSRERMRCGRVHAAREKCLAENDRFTGDR